MGYFDDCRPDQRFTTRSWRSIYKQNGSLWVVSDWDQRRVISVGTEWYEEDEDFVLEALAEHIDEIPPEAILIEVGRDSELVSWTSDNDEDTTLLPFYPSTAEFAADVPRIHRSDLIELERMGVQVDLVTRRSLQPGDRQRLAFKYYTNRPNVGVGWHELNCIMHLPKHPNIVPFHSLVIDTVDGNDKVVGFTTRFIPGDTILDNVARVFKLKYLQQLTEALDFLNLELGIVHGDIVTYNLLIDAETDNIQIFDFNMASKLGWEGDTENGGAFVYEADRNDVKWTIFTLYEIITRDMHFREENYPHELDASMVSDMDTWEKHPDVRLDAEVAEYRRVLSDWVEVRKKRDEEVTHWTQAPRYLDWPPMPEFPEVHWVGNLVRQSWQMRQDLVRRGASFLRWQRPPSCRLPLPQGQLLLATGQIVDDSVP
ncbi:hypothetical protein GQ53DRAFT_33051 [Thozetella sp. PMI_491]|nr:hypothetical protein GQ53DRAFT_33051 [Thozetella sp. PMI_491]